MGRSIVVLEKDPRLAKSLAGGLRPHFHLVDIAFSRDELLEKVVKTRAAAVVLDIECSRLSDVENLHRDFPALPIVCTHRVPDEEMWMAALEAGASDVCASGDVDKVLTAVLRSLANAAAGLVA